ncbi:MAG TPA: hypothetical protein VJ142_00170 [Candidatus Nanoarchaeia archaeon]|nr:hypothetical protein [Candidatus Nanoarchaeia archaeon]
MKNTKEALEWILNILRKNKIPFRISGGFAAKIYGSKRKLADIDIEVNNKNIKKIFPFVKKYVIYGPKRYRDGDFNLFLMNLKFKGQEIDIYGKNDLQILDKVNNTWVKEKINLNKFTKKKVYGLTIPLVPLKEVISYKEKIRRNVDLIDIKNLLNRQT